MVGVGELRRWFPLRHESAFIRPTMNVRHIPAEATRSDLPEGAKLGLKAPDNCMYRGPRFSEVIVLSSRTDARRCKPVRYGCPECWNKNVAGPLYEERGVGLI